MDSMCLRVVGWPNSAINCLLIADAVASVQVAVQPPASSDALSPVTPDQHNIRDLSLQYKLKSCLPLTFILPFPISPNKEHPYPSPDLLP